MPLRALSRSSLVLLLLCVLVFAQHPARLLVQGFVSTSVQTPEKADAATAPQFGIAALPATPAPPVPHDAPVHIDCVVTVHSTPLSVLRI
jgi:hypothetical protein